jgi:hypothetical protein
VTYEEIQEECKAHGIDVGADDDDDDDADEDTAMKS